MWPFNFLRSNQAEQVGKHPTFHPTGRVGDRTVLDQAICGNKPCREEERQLALPDPPRVNTPDSVRPSGDVVEWNEPGPATHSLDPPSCCGWPRFFARCDGHNHHAQRKRISACGGQAAGARASSKPNVILAGEAEAAIVSKSRSSIELRDAPGDNKTAS